MSNPKGTFLHGEAETSKRTPEYNAWRHARQRCNNKDHKFYRLYGGRGIKVCGRWDDFRIFLSDMGRRPSSSHSLDRIDNNRGYAPENCKWSTTSEQNRNRKSTPLYTYKGEKKSVVYFSEKYKINKQTLWTRIYKGWSIKKSIETPVRSKAK